MFIGKIWLSLASFNIVQVIKVKKVLSNIEIDSEMPFIINNKNKK